MNDWAISVILNYIEEYLFEPEISWPEIIFEERSYSRWAALELMERIIDHPLTDAITITEDFIFFIYYLQYLEDGAKKRRILEVAIDTASNILDLLTELQ